MSTRGWERSMDGRYLSGGIAKTRSAGVPIVAAAQLMRKSICVRSEPGLGVSRKLVGHWPVPAPLETDAEQGTHP